MSEYWQFAAQALGLFTVSLLGCWLGFSIAQARRKLPALAPGTVLRLRAGSGMYRTRIVEDSSAHWIIEAPVQRDRYVPLRPQEPVTVEATTDSGLLRFRTEVCGRDVETRRIRIEKPRDWFCVNRRGEERRSDLEDMPVYVESRDARLVDLSCSGARVIANGSLARGERLRLDLPWSSTPVFAWALDVQPSPDGSCEVRVRFEEPLALPATTKKGTLA